MKSITRLLPSLLALGAAAILSSCATPTSARLDAKTDAVLTAMSEKLAAAKTLRVNATRTASPGFHVGVDVSESASGTIVVQRPDKLAARIKSNKGARAVGLDGSSFTIVDGGTGTHSTVKAPGDIDAAISSIQAIYGATPPVAELLVNHPKQHLLIGVKSGRHTGTERIAGVECDRMAFQQDNLSWQLWVATGDRLPRRIAFSYPNGEGGAPLTANAMITKWEINPLLSAADLIVKAPAGSRAVAMIPLAR